MNIIDANTIKVILVAILASVLFVLTFKRVNTSADKERWYQRKENWWIIAGSLIALSAICIPFILMYLINVNPLDLLHQVPEVQGETDIPDYLSTLASMGDFLGGTTVGLLSLASIIFVTAAIFMQKEELELQRKEVSATRKEYEITNATMKKQQFDSTFFNMINLHNSITKDINILIKSKDEEVSGRRVFRALVEQMKIEKSKLNLEFQEELKLELKAKIKSENQETQYEFFKYIYIENRERLFYELQYDPYADIKDLQLEWKNGLSDILNDFTKYYNKEKERFHNYIEKIEFISKEDTPNAIKEMVSKYNEKFIDDTELIYKQACYSNVYEEHENEIGHYLRNLYRIIKYINEYTFYDYENTDDKEIKKDEEEKKHYRGVLRAQLSKYELLFLFYNISNSEVGKEFKEVIKGTNFFDDHIKQADFLWSNDKVELIKLNTYID